MMFNAITEPVYIAAIVAISSMFGPVLMAWINARTHRAERLEDYARQDEIARRLATSNSQSLAAHDRSLAATRENGDKLDHIHSLVNSNMTAALQSEFDAITRELAMMKEVISLKRTAGQEPSDEALAAVSATEDKLAELRTVLTARRTL